MALTDWLNWAIAIPITTALMLNNMMATTRVM